MRGRKARTRIPAASIAAIRAASAGARLRTRQRHPGDQHRLTDPLVRSRALDDDAFVACAAVVVSSRLECLSVIDAVEYLYYTADDIGVDTVEFARFITGSRQRRDWARGRPSRAQEDGHR